MPIEIGNRIVQGTGRVLLKEVPRSSRQVLEKVTSAAGLAFGKDHAHLTGTLVREAPSWLRPVIERYRLTQAPGLIAHLPKLAEVAGKDPINEAAIRAAGHQGLFERDLVALAEKTGYIDLAGLQGTLPVRHLVMDGCPFCQVGLFKPPGSILAETPNFAVGPMRKSLYAAGDNGGHLLVFPKHHRSVIGATPDAYRQEFLDLVGRTRRALEKQYGQPVSLISNGLPGHFYDAGSPYDTHAHVQLFTGNADITQEVIRFFGWSKEEVTRRVHPITGWDDYFHLYERGLLRQRYLVTMDASGKGHVIVIGEQPTGSGFARRMIAQALKLRNFSDVPDERAAGRIAEDLRGKIK